MAGRRVNLSELADEEPLADARVPGFAAGASRSVRIDTLSLNPLNTRDLTRNPAKIKVIAESMRANGQLQSCAVVTREAFLRIFPEFRDEVGGAAFVQVTGARRRAAAVEAGLAALKVDVMDHLAESRAKFLAATTAENIDREDLDPVEEARAVQLLVQESGSGRAAATQLSRTAPWVTQRLNLLKLVPEVQAMLRSGDLPLRAVRDWHDGTPQEQLTRLQQWEQTREGALTAVNAPPVDTDADAGQQPLPQQRAATPRPGRAAVAIRRLGGTPPKIAEALRAELPVEDIRALVALLSADL